MNLNTNVLLDFFILDGCRTTDILKGNRLYILDDIRGEPKKVSMYIEL